MDQIEIFTTKTGLQDATFPTIFIKIGHCMEEKQASKVHCHCQKSNFFMSAFISNNKGISLVQSNSLVVCWLVLVITLHEVLSSNPVGVVDGGNRKHWKCGKLQNVAWAAEKICVVWWKLWSGQFKILVRAAGNCGPGSWKFYFG